MDYYHKVQPSSSRWWIWPLLPFAAFIGATIGAFLLTLMQWFGLKMQGGFQEDGWYYLYILPVISSAAFGWLYALITLHLAPRGKLITASVMVTALGVLIVIGLLFEWLNQDRSVGHSIQMTIGSIATLSAAIATIVTERDEFE
ncbi:hypothetical protein [Microbulbifer guangxiensis]|uniref:hypothetical protein n=1 Tax=Microbulbifer guangxiensis TaxID=2904249 RepID=UPI001F383B95|nr:hypothetical protein [Microbulbifer guangxiensis]